ncbi:hypothetical protein [Fischerella thermalis]|nr:hypothetical protein [Fischerella thermalis]
MKKADGEAAPQKGGFRRWETAEPKGQMAEGTIGRGFKPDAN